MEVTGRTIEEALDAALDQLGVDEADIEYDVLEEPRRGFLGRMAGTARIRARVKPISREKPDRRRRSAGRSEGRSGGGRSEGGRPRGGGSRPAAGATGQGERTRTAGGDEGREGRSGDAQRQRNRSRTRKPRPAANETTGSSASEGEEIAVSGSDVPLSEQVELAERFTRGLVERFGLNASVTAEADGDDDVKVEITGSDLGLLIGPRAATLDAIQELVRTALQRRIGGHGARVHVDVDGYRARRHEALAVFVREAAERALESGRDQVFEPMSPMDRKVVHDTVNEIEGVATVSEGEEPRRRVVIRAL
ncbi:MAG: RNA-binding cell elongation regulator Jag/EloR [Acidimicrobiia bacterium]